MSLSKLKISDFALRDIESVFQYSLETFGEVITKNIWIKFIQKFNPSKHIPAEAKFTVIYHQPAEF